MIRLISTILFYFFTIQLAIAGPIFKETPLLKSAYQAIFNLRIDKAQELIRQSKTQDPDNYLVYHIENYIDFVQLFIGEDISLYEQLLPNKDKRLEMIKKGDTHSPYYLFSQAEIKLQWSIVSAKFDHKFRSGRDAYSGLKLLQENKDLFPSFILNQKSLSAFHALSESLPSWLRYVLNIKGSIHKGISEISSIIDYGEHNPSFIFKEESIAIYALILLHFDDKKEKAWEVINNSSFDPKNSPIAAFLMVNIAKKLRQNDIIIALLDNKPSGDQVYPFYYLDYLLGKSKLNKLDKDAIVHIQYFLDHFEGQHYIKEAYQKMAWYELVINDDFPKYKKYMQLCSINGVAILGSDIQAQKEATSNKIPDVQLLKTRLYFDGGYYNKAYQILIRNSYKYQDNPRYQVEFNYRMASVTEALKNYTDAINYYLYTIEFGQSQPEYYACKAAYRLGSIFEHERKYKEAKHFYTLCLTIEPVEYKNEIHAQATSGLDRINYK